MSPTSPPPLPTPLRVCLLGFGGFEKGALASALRLATQRLPTYVLADSAADCDLVVVDADQADALAAVLFGNAGGCRNQGRNHLRFFR